MELVEVYCDGACMGNGKKYSTGGWGSVIIYKDHTEEHFGGIGNVTSPVAEVFAAIASLQRIPIGYEILIHSDSKYLVTNMNNGNYRYLNKNKWVWDFMGKQLFGRKQRVHFEWIKGHSDNIYNNRADELAKQGLEDFIDNSAYNMMVEEFGAY